MSKRNADDFSFTVWSQKNDDVIDKCASCENHFNLLTKVEDVFMCDKCAAAEKKKEIETK